MVYRKQTEKLIDWNIHQYNYQTIEDSKVENGYENTNVWYIHPKSNKVHSAIFHPDLCKKIIKYYSFKGDLVFDPFAGSGTIGKTSQILGRYFFLVEKKYKYFEYIKSSLDNSNLLKNGITKFLTIEEFKESITI